MADVSVSTSGRFWRCLLIFAVLVAAVAAGWWAGRLALTSEALPSDAESVATATWGEAAPGSVGRSLALSTTLRQPALPVAENGLAGVVTAVKEGEVAVGDTVYVVGSTPVRVVKGERPFYRDLAPGSRGWDVTQLQDALTRLGYRSGPADGVFGSGTASAVRAWQKDLGQPQTGTVALGELVAVRRLPGVVRLGDRVTVGTRLAGGEDAVLAPTGVREFALVVGAQQAQLIPAEASVEVIFQDRTWAAVIAEVAAA